MSLQGSIAVTLQKGIFILLSLCYSACSNMTTEPQPIDTAKQPVLLPTAVGNFWTYETARYVGEPDTVTIRNVKTMPVEVNGQLIKGVVQEHFWEDYGRVWPHKFVYGNGSDGLYQLGAMSTSDTLIQPALQVKYPVELGESWKVPLLGYESDSEQYTYNDSLIYHCVSVDCTYTTATGSFGGCLVVKYYKPFEEEDVANGQNFYIYYKPDLGIVAIEVKNYFPALGRESTKLYFYRRLINFSVQNYQN